MAIVFSTVGSPTYTGWKRRSRAASFSTCLRYSSSVVAPTTRSSPRASIGLSMLPASIEPSALPAPTSVCISSMNTTNCPSLSVISLSTALSRSSNSPRNLAPAMSAPRSSATRRLFLRLSGTSPLTMRWASPSTIAVLPTPGSPMSTGLFLVRRDSTWITRRISSSRPITGSSLPLRAASVRSRVYRCSAWYWFSGFWSVTRWVPRTASSASSSALGVAPASSRMRRLSVPLACESASSRCSVDTYSSPSDLASLLGLVEHGVQLARQRRLRIALLGKPARSPARSARECRSRCRRASADTGTTMPSSCASSAERRCGS